MLIGYFSFVALLLIFLFWMKRSSFFQLDNLTSTFSFAALFLKIASAFALWFVYTYYYTNRANADIYKYFDDAAHIYALTEGDWALRLKILFGFQNDDAIFYLLKHTQFWDSSSEVFFNDNRTMTRIHLALLPLSVRFYPFHVLFFALISFIGSCGIFQFFRKHSSLPNLLLFVICFLIPSFLFWNSAPLKETFLVFSLGLLLHGISAIQEKKNAKNFGLLAAGLLGMLCLKMYLLFALLPSLWFWTSTVGKSKSAVNFRFIWIHALTSLALFSPNIIQTLSVKQSQFKQLIIDSGANSAIEISSFDSVWSLLAATPQALFNAFIRPVFPINWNPFSLISAAEHVILIGVLLLPLIFRKRMALSEQRLALFCVSFTLISCTLIGLTVPVLGGIVRYKAPLLPFYLVAALSFVNLSKISPKFK